VSAFITHLVYLKDTRIDVMHITSSLGVKCIEVEGGSDSKFSGACVMERDREIRLDNGPATLVYGTTYVA